MLSDTAIIELYWQRDESAIRETDRKYRKYLHTIAYHIVHDARDCEECLNDTYLSAWEAIPPARPNALKAFLTTIMRRTAITRYHHAQRKRAVPSELTVSLSEIEAFVASDAQPDETFDAQRLGQVISDHIRSLPQRSRYIFMSRYYFAEPIDTIAKALALSRSTVNKELAAIRAGLKEKLESEGYFL